MPIIGQRYWVIAGDFGYTLVEVVDVMAGYVTLRTWGGCFIVTEQQFRNLLRG